MAGVPLPHIGERKGLSPFQPRPIRQAAARVSGIGAEPDILCEMSNYMDAVALAEQNVGISIFPQTAPETRPGIVCRRIVEPSHQARYLLVRKRNASMSELSQTFLDFVTDSLQATRAASGR